MRRLRAALVLALAAVAAWPSAVAESQLTPRNSIVAALPLKDSVTIRGVGCGVSASATFTPPAGTVDLRIQRPSAGAREGDAQLTNVSVQGTAATFTAVADGPSVCDPGSGSTPPANRPWFAHFDVEAAIKQRVGVVHFDLERTRGSAFKVRPRAIPIRLLGSARRIRWRRFGGREAVGSAVFRAEGPCPGGCTDNGTRLTVKLTRPSRCANVHMPGHTEDAVFYGKFAFVLRERLGVLRPGREWISKEITCPPAGSKPIRIR
jgi:hypothetical protein